MSHDIFQKESIRQKSLKTYESSYAQLNAEQKLAVDRIDGPVMVIAGPGTGKTQILAVRIAKILQETDAQPHNILCLTFTDAATIAMRQRLVQIIGPAAHQVHIYTFHGFCNQVIQENLAIFGNYRQLEPLSELEKVDVYKEIIDGLPNDHILKRLKGDPTYEAKRLNNLFSMMKKDNLLLDGVKDKIDDYLERKNDPDQSPEMFYKRNGKGYQKGDRKDKEWDKITRQMDELLSGAELFDTYKAIMDRLGRYDYQDMILWVLERFEKDDHLLADYQERYQYFLVDEFQDTNGAQKALLEALISFWEESPNVFVVGDDDQAIYKFQGANLSNIQELKSKYKPYTVVLKNNYRSSQKILDLAKELIVFNKERIVNDDPTLDKNLVAASPAVKDLPREPIIKSYANIVQEQAALAEHIVQTYQRGEDLGQTAIIYRKHAQVEKLVEVLEKKGVPLNIKRKVDILKIPLIKNVLTILYYIDGELQSPNEYGDLLFEIMHYRFFPISSNDIAQLSIYCKESGYDNKVHLQELIANEGLLDELAIRSKDEVLSLSMRLDKWIADIHNVTLQVLFESIINEGKILQYVLNQANKTWLLQVLSTFFDLIKEETSKDPAMNLTEFLAMIDKMKANNLPLEINKIVHSANGVHFITAHSAKGLEFERVIVPGVTKDVWDTNSRNMYQYAYPDNINEDVETNAEDERRLLYVALTRAEQELDVTYSLQKENGKILGSSQFIDEMVGSLEMKVEQGAVAEDVVNDFQYYTLLSPVKDVQLIDHDRIDQVLQKYKLSVTGLNKYLKCPLTFYFETILQVPTARTKYMGFGRAIHYALEEYYQDMNRGQEVSLEVIIKHFRIGMSHHRSHFTDEDYVKMMAYGEQILPKYYEHKLTDIVRPESFGLEIKIDNTEYKGVPIKGVLDRVDIHKGYVDVTDYKTGNAFKHDTKSKLYPPSDKNPAGGDYWRQIVFYKMLLDNDSKHKWSMTSGVMDFIEPEAKTDEFFSHKIVVAPDHLDFVGAQIVDVWQKINNHEFDHGCGEETCRWCSFIQNDYVQIGEYEGDEDSIQED